MARACRRLRISNPKVRATSEAPPLVVLSFSFIAQFPIGNMEAGRSEVKVKMCPIGNIIIAFRSAPQKFLIGNFGGREALPGSNVLDREQCRPGGSTRR